jgi:hypothetical protein
MSSGKIPNLHISSELFLRRQDIYTLHDHSCNIFSNVETYLISGRTQYNLGKISGK